MPNPRSKHPLPAAAKPCRVAIAGTITNALTGDIVPQAVVRITAAPAAFAERLMAFLVVAIAHRPDLQAEYSNLIADWNQTLVPLATAQRLLDRLVPALALTRPDQTTSGGDGHYCFFDLPPGQYRLTATYTLPNRCHGTASTPVDIVQSDRRLTFTEANIAIRLEPDACPLAVVGHTLGSLSSQPWGEEAVAADPAFAASSKAETRFH
ncbi:carboxypeptidase regulatory-like domain-containing protein [Nodosilinea sp. LEGE 06152]|uniref:carboxypeptidase-like regulatory domain-containing protein n=1 Tax=Nodosilinea sp. LEGE 06152 TaxID=2777966 RepID=UPI0018812205|nr:carboxypeptidase-like regulatory domain-containing protein [Nodosilinea sp. LEGE 06152]MBE9156239.1 carboxypeptidase regulatory-like domain-containing protein [Nodosilinea sp. LEGE 06152]